MVETEPAHTPRSLSLLSWRRAVHELYARVRVVAVEADDPARAHATWRTGRDRLFAEHPDTPLLPEHRAGFTGNAYAPYDPTLRWTLPVLPAEPLQRPVPTATDGVVPFARVGRVELPGGRGSLDLWWLTQYGGGLFVPLRDGTSGRTTYGGGRYLLDTVKGADLGGAADGSTLVIDLNFAYNPSCAYDPAWVCPLAAPGNVLDAPVEAGELYVPREPAEPLG
jgi:uncharacterized protein (DUF1684 family)